MRAAELDDGELSVDLGVQATDELLELHAAFDVAATRVDPQRAGRDVVVADHQHIGKLLQLGAADSLSKLIVGIDDVDTETFGS